MHDLRKSDHAPHQPLAHFRAHSPFHAVMHNPVESRLLATANTKDGVSLYDVRKTRSPLLQYTDCLRTPQSAMSVRFNCRGTQILALRRRLPPILYNMNSPFPVAEFDHPSYYNSCTMKSCCFGGDDDQFILSGSDDFKLYAWKIPDTIRDRELKTPEQSLWVDEANLVLLGHRSIVNQVRYNYKTATIASSGVEKVIKLWSVFPFPSGSGSLEAPYVPPVNNRKVYSHEDYINLVLESGQFMTHDYSHQSVSEDPRMMAFFDSLVQRDIEGWTSESSDDSLDGPYFYRSCYNPENESSTSSSSLDSSEDETRTPQILSYLSCLTSRIKSRRKPSADRLEFPDASQPSTSTAVTSSNSLNKEDIASEANRITQLINDKKREQLRKVARMAVRCTRKKVKKAKKTSKVDDDDPVESEPASPQPGPSKCRKIEELTKISERLSHEVRFSL